MMLNQADKRLNGLHDRMDQVQAETNARFDKILETIMSFGRCVLHIEGRVNAQITEAAE